MILCLPSWNSWQDSDQLLIQFQCKYSMVSPPLREIEVDLSKSNDYLLFPVCSLGGTAFYASMPATAVKEVLCFGLCLSFSFFKMQKKCHKGMSWHKHLLASRTRRTRAHVCLSHS